MVNLPEYILERVSDGLRSVPAGERADTYAVSFFVYDQEDDPWRPTLTVGTNTESRVEFALNPPPDFELPSRNWRPSDGGEARWNYAFWLQNELAVIADSDEDPVGAELCEQWLRERGLWVAEPDDDDWENQEVTTAFVELLIKTALGLHRSGLVKELFGRPIPIIIHELEYHDEIVRQTVAANPDDLAADFRQWVMS